MFENRLKLLLPAQKWLNMIQMLKSFSFLKGTGKRGHIVANTNVSPFARARNICFGHRFCVRDTKKMVIVKKSSPKNLSADCRFLILVGNILCPQQMFPSLRNMETMLPRFQYFPGLLVYFEHAQNSLLVRQNGGKYSTPLSTQPYRRSRT